MIQSKDRANHLWEPGKLWSLWDYMREFEAYRFIALANALGSITSLAPEQDVVIDDAWKAENVAAMEAFLPVLLDLGMDASHVSLERLLEKLKTKGVRFSDLAGICYELQGRLQDQAQRRYFFVLSPKEADLVGQAFSGWESALQRFPDIAFDVREAAVCLALFRHAASVYHSVQITERGLVELGTFLGVTDPHSGWTAVTSALEKVVKKKHSERSDFEKANFSNIEQIYGTVQALKNAWRNKISHAHGRLVLLGKDFGVERAEEILMATRAFMRRLADDIPPLDDETEHSLADISDITPDAFDPSKEQG